MPYRFSETFKALSKEAHFTREMLGSGATQIRSANYASKGLYFQAFTSLSTGLERIGKLCLMLDYFLDHKGSFPDAAYMRDKIGHNLDAIYKASTSIIAKRSIKMDFLRDLDDPIHQAILSVLSEFALGDRYSNINILVGGKRQDDPIATWFNRVDQPLWEARVSPRKKEMVQMNARAVGTLMGHHSSVLQTSDSGKAIADIEEASHLTGMWEAVAPFRQLYILQIIRYWTELLSSLHDLARCEDIPDFLEIFAPFYNKDSYIRTRKTWDAF